MGDIRDTNGNSDRSGEGSGIFPACRRRVGDMVAKHRKVDHRFTTMT